MCNHSIPNWHSTWFIVTVLWWTDWQWHDIKFILYETYKTVKEKLSMLRICLSVVKQAGKSTYANVAGVAVKDNRFELWCWSHEAVCVTQCQLCRLAAFLSTHPCLSIKNNLPCQCLCRIINHKFTNMRYIGENRICEDVYTVSCDCSRTAFKQQCYLVLFNSFAAN